MWPQLSVGVPPPAPTTTFPSDAGKVAILVSSFEEGPANQQGCNWEHPGTVPRTSYALSHLVFGGSLRR